MLGVGGKVFLKSTAHSFLLFYLSDIKSTINYSNCYIIKAFIMKEVKKQSLQSKKIESDKDGYFVTFVVLYV